MKASKVTSQNVFRHQAISVIIKKQWFGQGQRNFGVNMASEEFRRVPDNIICLVCNAVSVDTIQSIPFIAMISSHFAD